VVARVGVRGVHGRPRADRHRRDRLYDELARHAAARHGTGAPGTGRSDDVVGTATRDCGCTRASPNGHVDTAAEGLGALCGISRGFLCADSRRSRTLLIRYFRVPVPPSLRHDHENSSKIMKFCHPSLDWPTTTFAAVIRDDAVTARDAAEGNPGNVAQPGEARRTIPESVTLCPMSRFQLFHIGSASSGTRGEAVS
jgi:hypothetical protein